MKKFLFLLVMCLLGCEPGGPETSGAGGSVPEFAPGQGQEPRIDACKYNIVDTHPGQCFITLCEDNEMKVKYKPGGWWCVLDHPDGPKPGTCNGYGSCKEDPGKPNFP